MPTTAFPVPTLMMVAWVVFLGVAVYFFARFLKSLLRKNRRDLLLLCFLTLLVLGAVIHVVMLSRSDHTVTDGNWVQLALAGPGLAEAAARIPNVYEGSHYPEKGPDATHLEYLAIQSHLRWTSSHLAAGYVCGERNELLMRLPDIKSYDDVRERRFNHFDWIAVKTYLTEDIETS